MKPGIQIGKRFILLVALAAILTFVLCTARPEELTLHEMKLHIGGYLLLWVAALLICQEISVQILRMRFNGIIEEIKMSLDYLSMMRPSEELNKVLMQATTRLMTLLMESDGDGLKKAIQDAEKYLSELESYLDSEEE